jgi:iron complex outermembrane receptor protein
MFAEAHYERPFGLSALLTLRGYADSYQNDNDHPFGPAEGPDRDSLTTTTNLDSRSLGAEVRVRWDQSPRHRVVSGIEVQGVMEAKHEVGGTSGESFYGDHPYRIFSAYLQDELQVMEGLRLTLGLRHDQYSIQGTATTPRVAVVYRPSPATTVKLLAGSAFRAPNLVELYTLLPRAALMGNPDLEPERVRTLALVWQLRYSRVAITVSPFYNTVEDFIEQVDRVAPDTLGGFGRTAVQWQNIANASTAGVDFEARLKLHPDLDTRVGYSLLSTREDATGERLINAPMHQARLTNVAEVPLGTLALTIRGESGRRTRYAKPTDGFVVVDATVTSIQMPGGLTAQLSVRNLFDTEYRVPGAFHHVQNAIPQKGRTMNVSLGLNW